MNFDAEKWSLLEKAQDYRFVLRLLAFALVADLLLVQGFGANLWTFRWGDVSGRPGLLVLLVLAYGTAMTIGSALVSWVAMDLLALVVPSLQTWSALSPSRSKPDRRRYVSWSDAEEWLRHQPDAERRAPVEKQMADWREDRRRWASTVSTGWAGLSLVIASWWVPGTCVAALGQWQAWAPWVVLLVPVLPCAYHAWVGMPGHGQIELPKLAEQLYRRKYPRGLAFARSED